MSWYEVLPTNCPPKDTVNPQGKTFYRLCKGIPADSSDFYSQKKENPNRKFANVSQCTLSSVSIWDDAEKCRKLKKFPTQRNKIVGKFQLYKEDGEVKNTFKPNHYSWWRSDKSNHIFVEKLD